MKKQIHYAPLRPFIGGLAIAGAVWLLHGERYIGLGIPVIVDAFQHPLAPWDCFGKLIFTVVSLGSGFKGGEVTRCFTSARRWAMRWRRCCICRQVFWPG